jgi:hypothetical protein
MATASNVHLTIERISGQQNRRKVSVTYRVCFTDCEALAGSVFKETAILRGDDPIFDDDLTTIHSGCIKAQKGCVDRKFSKNVSKSTLDEDGDTVIFGIPIFADRDELYARVKLTPFSPSGSQADSNLVTGQFGAAA